MVAADPFQGGATWAVLQYVLGFQRLGHEVILIDPVAPLSLRPSGALLHKSANAEYFRDVVKRFSLEGRAALLLAQTEQSIGIPYQRLADLTRRADVLINISGMLTDPALI